MVAGALLAAVAAIYGQSLGHAFINYDDGPYVVNNVTVREGLTRHSLAQAFSFIATNWHPATWISHMTDVQIFGLRPWGHHLVNVIIHAGSAVLLFSVLKTMTGALWPSALVAALFAVHPLNVESVAWVAQRKTVLSTLFFCLTLISWLRWLRRPSWTRYTATLALFSLGLMAKPMLVTTPFVLLLLDWWPLNRYSGRASVSSQAALFASLLREKLAFLLLAGAAAGLTWLAQLSERTIAWVAPSLPTRLANAAASYGIYVLQAAWPVKLAALYPYPATGLPFHVVAGSTIFLVGISILAWQWRSKRPYLAAGWCWYLGTLVPVIGLVQVGAQSRADRYVYLPLVGIFIVLAWSISGLVGPKRSLQTALATAIVSVLLGLGVCSYIQTSHWRDSVTLNRHSALVTRDNYIVLNNLGVALREAGRLEDAKAAFRQALRIKPGHVTALINLGKISQEQRHELDAVDFFRRALQEEPDNPLIHFNLGFSFFNLGRFDESIEHFQSVRPVDFDPIFLDLPVMLKMARLMRDRASATRNSLPTDTDRTR